MAALRSTKLSSQVLLLHDHFYTIPGKSSLISLKAGEKFQLVEKLSENWWSVIRSEQDPSLLYVPASYSEEIPNVKKVDGSGNTGKKEQPPKPPVKPKNLFGKQEPTSDANRQLPPISSEAQIELYSILTSKSSDQWPNGSEVNEESGALSSSKQGYKGSMQSLDMEFLDDCDYIPTPEAEETQSPHHINTELLRVPGHQSDRPPQPPDGAVPLKTFEGGYGMYSEEETGRTYYYNRSTGERSWTLPRKVSQLTKETNATEEEMKNSINANSIALIWREEVNEKGEKICVNQINGERWVHLLDEKGHEYFFNDDTKESRWELPEFDANDERKFAEVMKEDASQFSDKVGHLYKAKLSENGKKIKKSWTHSHVLLCGSMLYFHKEQKTANNQKVNMSKPEAYVDLKTASVNMGNNVRSSRKNLIQLFSGSGTEYLLHHDDMEVIEEWYEALSKNIALVSNIMSTLKKGGSSHSSSSEIDRSPSSIDSPNIQKKNKDKEKQKTLKKGEVIHLQESPQSTADKTKLKEKLRSWMNKRPTKDSLRAKGIYKDSIFGSHLLTICEKENSTIPKFVKDCIEAVEARGLTSDGIYRLSGNMSDVQKLRFIVNQNEPYDLLDPDLDIHVVTGVLKLFFRELSEPLFPFRFFKKFLEAFNSSTKSKSIKELIPLIPTENRCTLKELFRHLVLVIQHSRENRMQAQNIAIVFGPTLMWPEETETSSSLAVSLVQRGQLIEHMLQDYSFIFSGA